MTNKQFTIFATAVALLIVGIVWFFHNQSSGTSDSSQTPAVNTPEHPDTADVKKAPTDANDNEPLPDSTKYAPVISRISQDSGTVFVRAYVSTFNEGECRLEMTKEGVTVTDSSGVSAQPSYLQCEGFDIEKSELGANYTGQWSIKVIYELNGQEYESQPQDFTVS